MTEVGAIFSLQDNASTDAKRIAEGFNEVAKSADGISSALDPQILQEYNNKLTQIGEAYSKLDRGIGQQNRSQVQQMQHAQQVFSGMGSAVVQAGRGDVAGGALGGVKSLGALAGKISPLVAGGLALTAGGGLAANAIANIYGERAGPAGDIARLQGDMGTDIGANTQALRAAMKSTVDSVSKFGKTYEEGAAATQAFLRAGGTDFAGTSQSAAYSLARSADFNRLASFEGMTQRYGMTGSLAAIDALTKAQGLDPKHYEEVMGGFQDIYSGRVSRGITGGTDDLLRSMEFFGKAGVTWKGAQGAQKLQGMNQAVAGAAGLQQQSDLFLYRAAAGFGGGSMIDIKKRMEGGLTQGMFKGLMGEFDRMGYDETQSILTLSNMFGLSTTDAEKLYNLRGQGIVGTEYTGIGGLAAGEGADVGTGYRENIEGVKQWVSELGEGFYDLRAEGIDKTIEGFKELVRVLESFSGETLDEVDAMELGNELFSTSTKQPRGSVSTRAASYANMRALVAEDEDLLRQVQAAQAAGVPSAGVRGILAGTNETEMIRLLTELIVVNKTTAVNTGADTEFDDRTGADGRDPNLSVGGGL